MIPNNPNSHMDAPTGDQPMNPTMRNYQRLLNQDPHAAIMQGQAGPQQLPHQMNQVQMNYLQNQPAPSSSAAANLQALETQQNMSNMSKMSQFYL